jgi:hypothetical protein
VNAVVAGNLNEAAGKILSEKTHFASNEFSIKKSSQNCSKSKKSELIYYVHEVLSVLELSLSLTGIHCIHSYTSLRPYVPFIPIHRHSVHFQRLPDYLDK